MRIGIPAEIVPGETRVAATPETVKKLAQGGHHTIVVQSGAGAASHMPDADYEAAGAQLVPTADDVYRNADLVLKVRAPEPAELSLVRSGSLLVGLLTPHDQAGLDVLARTGVTGFALEAVPRITRAQAMAEAAGSG